MENPEKIEIEGLKTIHKLCKFGADNNMEGCTFTEIVERMFDELAKAQAVPEGFVLVPKELSDEKADAQALLAWGYHKGLFKSQNRDMSALQVEDFRLKWCRNKARELQEEYKAVVKEQELSHD